MQNWKARSLASGIHLGVSLAVAAVAAILVFLFWYPYPYSEVSGGRSLFLLVVAVDVVIGPAITFVIFNRAKPRRELVTDFCIVGFLQIAALAYGLGTVYVARPVHVVFEYDRLTVLHAIDVDAQLLTKAPVALRALPVTGPTLVALRPFENEKEQFDATLEALSGSPLSARSDLWQRFEDSVSRVLGQAKPAADLLVRFPAHSVEIGRAVENTGRPINSLRSLPLVGRDQVWTALLDGVTAEPLAFVKLDSF